MKTTITMPDAVFGRVKRAAQVLGLSRSEFFTLAAERYLKSLRDESSAAKEEKALGRFRQKAARLGLAKVNWKA